MCVTKSDFWKAVRSECAEATQKALEFNTCRQSIDVVKTQRDAAQGALVEYRGIDANRIELVRKNERLTIEVDRRWSTLAVVLVSVGALAVGAGAGLALGAF